MEPMDLETAIKRVRALRGRLRSQGSQSTKPWKIALRRGDAEALTVLIVAACAVPVDNTPPDYRDGAQIIADAGMNEMGT